jgi:peptidoglycan/LPS O-acetylase OafA/YrhL
MKREANADAVLLAPKTHYAILDGLRGVAALLVVVFHLFEAYSGGKHERQIINHGYLAVDFFFVLSGFVVAYAYDDRWSGAMGPIEFFKRRLIRLQPMVIAGSVVGAALWGLQHYSVFPVLARVPAWEVGLVMAIGFTMIPLPPMFDIRGWQESYPLNGPQWSLFYEYVANLLYAIGLRRLSNRMLALVLVPAALALVWLGVGGGQGDMTGGWSLDASGVRIGLTRVAYPFFAGVLLMRLGLRIKVANGFAVASLLLLVALAAPRFGGPQLWINGLYEAACIIVLFPLIVAIGAGELEATGASVRIARFFGDLSYPLYITHYPLIYIYTGWVIDAKVPPLQGAIAGVGLVFAAVAIAWTALKVYDAPLRKRLAKRFLARSA